MCIASVQLTNMKALLEVVELIVEHFSNEQLDAALQSAVFVMRDELLVDLLMRSGARFKLAPTIMSLRTMFTPMMVNIDDLLTVFFFADY